MYMYIGEREGKGLERDRERDRSSERERERERRGENGVERMYIHVCTGGIRSKNGIEWNPSIRTLAKLPHQ